MKFYLMILLVATVTGCRYYKVGVSTNTSQDYIVERGVINRDYVIIHENGKAWHLEITDYKDDVIIGLKQNLNFMHMETLKGLDHTKVQRYRKTDSSQKEKS